jgi:hypothetical protein
MNLTTLTSVSQLLEIVETDLDPNMQAQLEAKISEVSRRAAAFCNREFERVERVSYHDGGSGYLFLTETPVQEIAEILYSSVWEWESATEYTTSNYALVNAKAGMVGYKGGTWPAGAKAYQVTYTGGYDPAPAYGGAEPEGYVPIPADLEGAVCQQVAYEWRRRNDPGLQSVSLPDGTINKMQVDEWLKSVEQTLRRYRVRPG